MREASFPMTSEKIEKLIHKEIGSRWDISNAHGVDLKKCLVRPHKCMFVDPLPPHKSSSFG